MPIHIHTMGLKEKKGKLFNGNKFKRKYKLRNGNKARADGGGEEMSFKSRLWMAGGIKYLKFNKIQVFNKKF
jgi:hypothetical protein